MSWPPSEASRTCPELPEIRRTQTVRSASRPAEGLRPPPHLRPVPGYGRDPVGNGHAAAGFSAILAPELTPADGILAAVDAVLALGLAGLLAAFFFGFFFAAFFFLPATFLGAFFLDDFLLPDAFFFFFFLPPFFAFFFFAIQVSLKWLRKKARRYRPGLFKRAAHIAAR